jgi:hypothetical protein
MKAADRIAVDLERVLWACGLLLRAQGMGQGWEIRWGGIGSDGGLRGF